MQRVPALDGASGLHYSGRIYLNQAEMMSKDICSSSSVTPDQITVEMPNSISTASLPVDESTKRISTTAIQGYVTNLVSAGKIPGQLPKFDDQVTADKAFYASVQTEYCYYEARYIAALTQFLTIIADPASASNSAGAQAALNQAVALNRRLNSLLEIINFVGNDRAQKVNARGPEIDRANASLQEKMAALAAQKNMLQSADVRTRTQEEMMRFSGEKNRAMNIQIMFFVALNVVAIGTVMSVYGSMKPAA
jgi:hypothetical protein